MWKPCSVSLLCWISILLILLTASEAKKIKRTKAGRHYNVHDAVHIVVNKVGYVT